MKVMVMLMKFLLLHIYSINGIEEVIYSLLTNLILLLFWVSNSSSSYYQCPSFALFLLLQHELEVLQCKLTPSLVQEVLHDQLKPINISSSRAHSDWVKMAMQCSLPREMSGDYQNYCSQASTIPAFHGSYLKRICLPFGSVQCFIKSKIIIISYCHKE